MIVASMTREEVTREIREDSEWLLARYEGIKTKYRKQIKAHRTGEKLLCVSKYVTPHHNTAYVVWYLSGAGKKECHMGMMHYFQYMTPAGCQYIHPTYRNLTLITYTSHFIQRLQEREGMTFMDFIKQFIYDSSFVINYDKYEYKGKEVNVIPFGDFGFQVYVDGDWGISVVTYISKKQYKGDQNNIITAMADAQKRENDEFMRYKNSKDCKIFVINAEL